MLDIDTILKPYCTRSATCKAPLALSPVNCSSMVHWPLTRRGVQWVSSTELEKIRGTLIPIHIAQINVYPSNALGIRSSAHVAILLSPPSCKSMQSTVDHARDMTQFNAIPIFFSGHYAVVLDSLVILKSAYSGSN